MKFMSILLKEGRKEDLIKKYESKFTDEGLSNVFNDQFIKQTNYKYADFILKNLDSSYSYSELGEAIDFLRKFDRIQSNLERKDINSYTGFFDLITTVNEYTKQKEKPKSKKIYEDDKFVVIEPQNYVASCKYGSKTRWCTTMKDNNDYFNRYTSGIQGLYYVISKRDLDENLYKIAIHFGKNRELTFYDASDSTFSKREIAFFKSAYPEMWNAIKQHYDSEHPDLTKERIKEALSHPAEREDEFRVGKLGNLGDVRLELSGFDLVESQGNNFMANNELRILDITESPSGVLIDEYMLFINVELREKNTLYALDIDCQLEGSDEDGLKNLGLDGYSFQGGFMLYGESDIAGEIARVIFYDIQKVLKNNNDLLTYFAKSPVWYPNRINYGYTFGKNKGLITKLVDWLDSSKVGTKLDFLVDIGKLDKKTENGKSLYSHKGARGFRPSADWRGHFASFFASAKHAGILDYRKVGNQFLLKKGPNFDAFKSGNLKAL